MGEIKNIIRIGCKTSHGGVVKTGSSGCFVEGKYPVACEGDIVSCPVPFHGDNPIVRGESNLIVDGRYAARDGWKTGCGAVLLNPTLPGEEVLFTAEGAPFIVRSPASPEHPDFNPQADPVKFDQKIYVRSPDGLPIVGQKYKLEYGDTKTGTLTTGQSGETILVKADYAHNLMIHFEKTDNLQPPQGDLKKPFADIGEEFDLIPIAYDKDGKPYGHAFLTPDFFKSRHVVRLPPSTVIPVVFVPGIMGTNLYNFSENTPAWQPPNGLIFEKGAAFFSSTVKKPADRQTLLCPKNTKVFTPDGFKLPASLRAHDGRAVFDTKEAKRRGFGEVHWDSYGKFLLFLEEFLNNRIEYTINNDNDPKRYQKKDDPVSYEWQELILKDTDTQEEDKEILSHWNLKQKLKKFIENDLKKFDKYYFAVHVTGYNWLKSSVDSAKEIDQKIKNIFKYYDNHPYYTHINKFILVSHSMGGLVTREFLRTTPDKNKIIGVIHGVQPVDGAPVVYRRMRAGTEVEAFRNGLFYLLDKMNAGGLSTVLGPTAPDVTAVMANSPGALELLPNKKYNSGKPWCKVFVQDGENSKELKQLALPKNGNPYTEIYSICVQDNWRGMVDKTLINPANSEGIDFDSYKQLLKDVMRFHDTLGNYFHDNTYAYYGNFENQPAYCEVVWKSEDEIPDGFSASELNECKPADPPNFPKLTYSADADIQIQKRQKELYKDEIAQGRCDVILNSRSGKQKRLTFRLQERHPGSSGEYWGDGTVPAPSGEGVSGHVKLEVPFTLGKVEEEKLQEEKSDRENEMYRMLNFNLETQEEKGKVSKKYSDLDNLQNKCSFEHQFSYDHDNVRLFVIWSIAKFSTEL